MPAHFKRRGKSLGAVVLAVVEIGNGGRLTVSVAAVETEGIDESIGIDRIGGDPVSGEIPAACVDQSGDGGTACLPLLGFFIPYPDTGIKGAAVADHAVTGGNGCPVAPDEVDTEVAGGGFAVTGNNERHHIHVADIVAGLCQARHFAGGIGLAHFLHGFPVGHSQGKPVQIEIECVKVFPEQLVSTELLASPGVVVCKISKGGAVVFCFGDCPLPVTEIVVDERGCPVFSALYQKGEIFGSVEGHVFNGFRFRTARLPFYRLNGPDKPEFFRRL